MGKIQVITKQDSVSSCPINRNKFMFGTKGYGISSNNELAKKQKRRYLAWQIAPNLTSSFKFAWQGIKYAFVTQRNFRIHTIMTVIALGLAFYLKATTVEMALISLTCAMVMVLELLNTALESVVDLTVEQHYHELAKIAKDCAAGAVLISAFASLTVAGFILLPHAIDFNLTRSEEKQVDISY